MNRKTTFVAAVGACLYILALSIMLYIDYNYGISNSNTAYRLAIGFITLAASVFCGGVCFFMFSHEEDFAWAHMIPIIPALVLGFFASQFLTEEMYPPMSNELVWAIPIMGIALAAAMPITKIASIAFAAKVLGVILFIALAFVPFFIGAWSILLFAILGIVIIGAGYFFGVEDVRLADKQIRARIRR